MTTPTVRLIVGLEPLDIRGIPSPDDCLLYTRYPTVMIIPATTSLESSHLGLYTPWHFAVDVGRG
jgi:hypothetical protein